jgi:hypothetical protein
VLAIERAQHIGHVDVGWGGRGVARQLVDVFHRAIEHTHLEAIAARHWTQKRRHSLPARALREEVVIRLEFVIGIERRHVHDEIQIADLPPADRVEFQLGSLRNKLKAQLQAPV